MTTTIHRMQNEWLAAGLALVITAGALAFANFGGGDDNGGVGPYVVCVGVILAAVLFGRVLPNAEDPARAGWILAAFALVTCVVFWTGLPFVLGMGAVYCGARAGRSGLIALGGLAIALAFVASVVG
jgi:FtsH-binding integral membrane protein